MTSVRRGKDAGVALRAGCACVQLWEGERASRTAVVHSPRVESGSIKPGDVCTVVWFLCTTKPTTSQLRLALLSAEKVTSTADSASSSRGAHTVRLMRLAAAAS